MAYVVLQEIRIGANGKAYAVEIASDLIELKDYTDLGRADYSFTGIPNEGKSYQIQILELNYGTTYDNNADDIFNKTEFTVEFGDDNTAEVDAHLQLDPPSYDQILNVDATAIGDGFRLKEVLSEVMYRDTGDNHPFHRISQHDAEPYGVLISLNAGIGSGTQSIWKWHTDGTLYEYQMNITMVDGVEFNSDTAPFYITYADAAYWNTNTDKPSNELKATLKPKQYLVSFNLNGGEDTVTGVETFWTSETGKYETIHTWGYTTAINATPEREGYTFTGWETDVADAYDGSKIVASNHQNVVLTARWEPEISYTIITDA